MGMLVGDELEHIDLGPAAIPAPPRWVWPRRRVLAVLVAVALVAGLLGPVRSVAVRRSFLHLRDIWLEAKAVSAEHLRVSRQLYDRAAPQDSALLSAASSALDREAAQRLARLRHAVDHDLRARFDGSVNHLRKVLDTALLGSTVGPTHPVEAQLAALERRFRPARQPAPKVRLTSARAALARFSQYSDEPTGLTVLATAGRELAVIDLDGNVTRTISLSERPLEGFVSIGGQPTWLISYGERPASAALSPDRRSTVPLGDGWGVPSENPDLIWLATERAVTELDRTGRVVTPPIALPASTYAAGATAAGVVLMDTQGSALEVWNPRTRHVLMRHRGSFMGGGGQTVVASENQDGERPVPLHILDALTGRERFSLPAANWTTAAAFTPDGSRFAIGAVSGIVIVDVESGAVERVESGGSNLTLAWSPQGRWIFWADDHVAGWDTHEHRRLVLRVPRVGDGPITSLAVERT